MTEKSSFATSGSLLGGKRWLFPFALSLLLVATLGRDGVSAPSSRPVGYLVTGRMRPAFDHLGNLGEQLPAALAGQCTIVYATGLGKYSYNGLPPRRELEDYLAQLKEYNRQAHAGGVGVMLSYLCATSIVKVSTFAANWDDYFPHRFAGFAPERMLQQDISGNNLPSWYGGDYAPADMWNPYWRQYTRFTIQLAVQSGHDGVFFDNPTVHSAGNYSPYAMRAWARFLKREGLKVAAGNLRSLRSLTQSQPERWRRFRVTEAADFIREMRNYGRSLQPSFILTVNNSLNSWGSFYSQPQGYAYSIPDQSRNQDFITIEDMGSQPRQQGDGYVSYGSTLRLLHAIGNGRPLSICTTDGDYVASPNLMKLSIAECTAHDAAYLVWSCWDPTYREANAVTVARYHRFLEAHASLFGNSRAVADFLVVWPYENWLRRSDCPTAELAQSFSARNLQYDVVTEAELTPQRLKDYRTVAFAASEGLVRLATVKLLVTFKKQGGFVIPVGPGNSELRSSLNEAWGLPVNLDDLQEVLKPASVGVEGSPGVRAVVRQSQGGTSLLHLYNLGVTRIDSYHDRVTPVENLRVSWLLPQGLKGVSRVRLETPDEEGTHGWAKCTATRIHGRTRIDFVVPKLWIWTVVSLP